MSDKSDKAQSGKVKKRKMLTADDRQLQSAICNHVMGATFMIMGGSKDATIRQAQLVDIHGTRFYDIAYSHDETPDAVRTARVGVESIYAQPQTGDAVRVSYLMNVVTEVTRR